MKPFVVVGSSCLLQPVVEYEHSRNGTNSSLTWGFSPRSERAGGSEDELDSQAGDEWGREATGPREVPKPSPPSGGDHR